MMLIKYKSDEDDDDAFISVLTVSLRPHPRSFPLLQWPGTRVKLLQVQVQKCSPEYHRRIHTTLFSSLSKATAVQVHWYKSNSSTNPVSYCMHQSSIVARCVILLCDKVTMCDTCMSQNNSVGLLCGEVTV